MPTISAPDLLILRGNRSDGSRRILTPRGLFVSVETQVEIFAGQINGAPSTDAQTFGIYQCAVDNTSGAAGSTLPHMTVDFGTSAGLNDLGQARLRDTATSTLLKLSEMSPAELPIANNHFFSVKRTFRPWLRLPRGVATSSNGQYTDGITLFVDYDIAYSDQNANFTPKANITRSATSNFAPKPAGFVDGFHTTSPQIFRTLVLSGVLSFCIGSSTPTYAWNVQDGTITVGGSTSATITATFPVGFRWISLTVTFANGKSGVMYFPIWVHNAANMPLSRFHGQSNTEDWRETQLEFFQQDTSETVIKKGAAICCWEDDPFWGETIPDVYRDQFLGWNKEDTTLFRKHDSRNTLVVTGLGEWMSRYRAVPMRVYDPGATPANWFEMQTIYNDKLAFYLLENFSTANLIANLTLSGNTDRIKSLDLTGNSLFGQVQYAVLGYQGKARTDSLNEIWLRKHYPYLTVSERAARAKVLLITQVDRSEQNPLQLTRRKYFAVASVLGAGGSFDGTTQTIYNSRAPGRTPYDSNSEQDAPGLNLPTTLAQDALNWMTGQQLGILNNANSSVPYQTLPNLDCIEPAWDEPITITDIAPDSGYTVTDKEFMLKAINITYDDPYTGRGKRTEYTLSEVTTSAAGQFVEVIEDTTDPPDYEPPQDIITFPITAPFTLNANSSNIGLLASGSLVHTGNFTSISPTWANEIWTFGSPLNLLDSGESIVDGVQKPGTARTLHTATNTKVRIFNNILDGTTVGLTYALRAASFRRITQTERGDPNIFYCITPYTDGFWSEGWINGVAITANRIGANFDAAALYGTVVFVRPGLIVDPNNPLIAYFIAFDGTIWRWYKTVDGGVSWNTTTDYNWSPNSFSFFIARSFSDASRVFVGRRLGGGDSGTEPIERSTSSATTQIRSDGGINRRGLRTLDSDANTLFHVRWFFTTFGNFRWGIQKSHDAGDNWTTIRADTDVHNVEPSGYFGGDGSVFQCHFGVIRFHPNIYTLAADADFTDKTGTGYPAFPFVPINLFGL